MLPVFVSTSEAVVWYWLFSQKYVVGLVTVHKVRRASRLAELEVEQIIKCKIN